MKNLVKLFLFILLISFSANSNAENPYKEITADELMKMKAENKDLVIIDSRGADWFDGVMIEGAKLLAVADTDEKSLAAIAPDKTQAIVFYCVNTECPASAKAAHKAAELGYTNLYKLPGGIEEWKKLGLPTSGSVKKEESKS